MKGKKFIKQYTPGGKKMKLKKLGILGLLSLITVLMAGIVHGADPTCAFDQTATTAGTSSTYIRETQNLSVTITNPGEAEGKNATSAIISVNTGTITGALSFNTTAGTNNSYLNTTVITFQLKDDTTYTFTMSVKNESQGEIATCNSTFIPDNTVPVVSLTTPADLAEDTDGEVTFTYACTNSSSATLYIESTPYTMTESSDTCTYTGTWPSNGFHSHYIIGSDGLNSTTSTTSTVNINRPGSPGVVLPPADRVPVVPAKEDNWFAFVVFAAIIYFVSGKAKKGRKK